MRRHCCARRWPRRAGSRRWSRSPATPTATSRSSAGSGSRGAASRCSSSFGTRFHRSPSRRWWRASWVLLRLPKPVDELFERWLEERYPERRARVLGRIRDTRAGRLSDSTFGRRQRGQGQYAEQIAALFAAAAKKHGLDRRLPPLETGAFRRPPTPGTQLSLL